MRKTKDKICCMARKLFGQRGYDDVSLRDIAQATGITVGNLSYHFPKKEMLISAVHGEFYSQVERFVQDSIANRDFTLEKVVHLWSLIDETIEENTYYFKNIIELNKNHTVVRSSIEHIRNLMSEYYFQMFKAFRNSGIMRSDVDNDMCATLGMAFLATVALWQQNFSPYQGRLNRQNLSDTLMNLLRFSLSPTGRAELDGVTRRVETAAFNA